MISLTSNNGSTTIFYYTTLTVLNQKICVAGQTPSGYIIIPICDIVNDKILLTSTISVELLSISNLRRFKFNSDTEFSIESDEAYEFFMNYLYKPTEYITVRVCSITQLIKLQDCENINFILGYKSLSTVHLSEITDLIHIKNLSIKIASIQLPLIDVLSNLLKKLVVENLYLATDMVINSDVYTVLNCKNLQLGSNRHKNILDLIAENSYIETLNFDILMGKLDFTKTSIQPTLRKVIEKNNIASSMINEEFLRLVDENATIYNEMRFRRMKVAV